MRPEYRNWRDGAACGHRLEEDALSCTECGELLCPECATEVAYSAEACPECVEQVLLRMLNQMPKLRWDLEIAQKALQEASTRLTALERKNERRAA